MTTWAVLLLMSGCQKAGPAVAPAAANSDEARPPQATTTPAYTLGEDASPMLLDPDLATETAPPSYDVRLTTSQGDVVVHVERSWAPHAADRFYNLVQAGFYDQAAFFRTIHGFVAQFGISAFPQVSKKWRDASIPDDTVLLSNTRGRLTMAMRGTPNSRTTQLFINLTDNTSLDRMGFAPFAEVTEGMEVIDTLHETGEGRPRGPGPSQGDLYKHGNTLIDRAFPDTDRVLEAVVLQAPADEP
ncbi:MAG: peptidylprolyl isomerase [Myxococcota bacterium]